MIVSWHCRTCNEKGTISPTINEIIKIRDNENLLVLLIKMIGHSCEQPNVGIKLGEENEKR